MLILRKIVIGTFNNFVDIHGSGPKQNKGKGTCTSFLTYGSEPIAFFIQEN